MERITIHADYALACDLIDSFYTLYMAIVEDLGGNTNDPNIHKEGEAYARKKFRKLVDEFEDVLPMRWAWIEMEEDEE